ncbi:hypothetical protein BKP35_16190 [Anaerobacillus arseniciselenatis]|uniref:Uncharacterized protein n=1 Tax=Anaerobacillus arseniciselenatis TaxID=85682 RepID=A0A1S2LAM1_9BACI|nr:hypothetical protein [Anaerobacillus arseniciselenatis]OIJ09396.1 hypothetical protein BKP35_16190 [Anaerobacillus arseniciselenatis]
MGVNKKKIFENLSDRCMKKSFSQNESLNIYDEMFKLKTIWNEDEKTQEAIEWAIADRIFSTNYSKLEEQEMMNTIEEKGYV